MQSSHITTTIDKTPSDIIDKIKTDLNQAKSQLISIQRNIHLQDEYLLFAKDLADIDTAFTSLMESKHHAENTMLDLHKIEENVNTFIKKCQETIAPRQVRVTDKFYNHSIQRICFRGDDRPPVNSAGTGMFQIGFNKKQMSEDYAKWVKQFYYIEQYDENVRIRRPLAINRAKTVPTSKDPRSAAFFPIVFKLTKLNRNEVIAALKKQFAEDGLESIDIDAEYNKAVAEKITPDNKEYLLCSNYNESQKKILMQIVKQYYKTFNDDMIDKLMLQIEAKLFEGLNIKDTSWIYVVYVDKGFDVSGHGFLYAQNNKFSQKEHFIFYAQEICTDAILPVHVIAGIEIERDFTGMKMKREYMRELEEFFGEATFHVKQIAYNENALVHFKEKYDVDVEIYKNRLTEYFQQQEVFQINLAKDGYQRSCTI